MRLENTNITSLLSGQVEWMVEDKVLSFGQNLTLFCAVDDCCSEFPGWVLWNYDGKDYRTIVIDLRSFKSSKYAGDLRKNGFTLVLKHLTETDMNRNYSCTYGSIVGEKKLLVIEEAFKPRPTVTKSAILTNGALIGIVVAACIVVILVILGILALCFWKRRDNDYRLANPLSVVVEPTSSTVLHGNSQTITCIVTGQPPGQSIAWYFAPPDGGREIINIDSNNTKYSGGTMSNPSLTILHFQSSDSGSYTCSLTNAVETIIESEPCLLTYINILSLVVEPDHANVIIGNNQTITCSISGQPSARGIIWYFTPTYESKVEISPENNAAKYSGGTISDPSLTILNFQTSDNGAYVCTATNTAGRGNSNSSVLTCISNCQKLKDSFLSEIAKRLGHDWKRVPIALEITTQELEQIERKYINEPVTQTTEALIMWRNRKSNSTEEDNVKELINALTFVERQDIIDDLRLEM
ncbi:titin-like isoform X2 [Mytilus californianus]|uniref:titin-like isoform X2 n=1 Tax=Mytilus californianus TaxID=6549 RepID=UPI0022473214|nr:titin-like isoform X2 [Mytilus californianus]